jgi:hypothetical protein
VVTTREELHRLLDTLADEDLDAIAHYLRERRERATQLAVIPDDDEPPTEEEDAAFDEADRELVAGMGIPNSDLRRIGAKTGEAPS